MNDETRAAAHIQILQMLEAYRGTILAVVALESGVLDILNKAEMYVDEVIELAKFDYDCGRRFLRALAALRFIKIEGELCELDETGKALVSSPLHLRERALLIGREYIGAWLAIPSALEAGRSGFEHSRQAAGDNVWAHRRAHPELSAAFTRVMRSNVAWVMKELESFPFEDYTKVVDLGGADGTILQAILGRYPRLEGVVLDFHHVVDGLEAKPRLAFFGGSFFDYQTLVRAAVGTDLIMLCNVLHDFPDCDARNLLRACYEASLANILIVERILGDPLQPVDALRDLHMMAVTGGKQRTRAELAVLFDEVGLRIDKEAPQWLLVVPK